MSNRREITRNAESRENRTVKKVAKNMRALPALEEQSVSFLTALSRWLERAKEGGGKERRREIRAQITR